MTFWRICGVMALLMNLSACASYEPVRMSNDTAAQLQQEPDPLICQYAYFSQTFTGEAPRAASERVLDEGIRRGLIRADRADAIRHNKVSIGMNECEAHAAWGFPNDINTMTTAAGSQEQWVYGTYASATSLLYVEGGLVTAIQN